LARREQVYSWDVSDDAVVCRSDGGEVYRDTRDHWDNGLRRILHLEESQARAWVEDVATESRLRFERPFHLLLPEERIQALAAVTPAALGARSASAARDEALLRSCQRVNGLSADVVWATHVGNDPSYAVVGSTIAALAWLVDVRTGRPPEDIPVLYEEKYFQGGAASPAGYGDYSGQRWWREEKASRQLRETLGLLGYLSVDVGSPPRALDVGAGFGLFRQALAGAGWEHEGVELSEFANEISESWYGFSAHRGTLTSYASTDPGTFDVISMWDLVEHVPDVQELLTTAQSLLKVGGALCIRTPNIDALEREVCGSAYHSFKVEHLWYFSPRSLVAAFAEAGLSMGTVTSQAHLFRGVLGESTLGFASLLRGSDLLAVAIRTDRP
jgi:2-polyprenyl-3-methyl-5-hydroxy-6-metoxy-1,4-benzoquinol methylase